MAGFWRSGIIGNEFSDIAFSGPTMKSSPEYAKAQAKIASEFTFASPNAGDYVFSPDGSMVYVAGADGTVRSFDVASRHQVDAWHIGTQLGGIDISPDGNALLVVERTTILSTGDQWGREAAVAIHTIDTRTGAATTAVTSIDGYDGTFFDVATTNDGKAILSQAFNGSGWTPITVFDIATNTFQSTTLSFAASGYGPTLRSGSSHERVVVLPSNISDAPLYMYQAGAGIVARHDGYKDGISGYNNGVVAISDEAKLVVQGLGRQINIYDTNLNYLFDLNDYKDLGITSVDGATFSADGKTLFVLDLSTSSVVAIGTRLWEPVATYHVAAAGIGNIYGNALAASADGSYLSYVAADGIHLLDTSRGGRTFSGGADADAFVGGTGNDTFIVNHTADTVAEAANGGYDLVRSSISFTLPENVEALTLLGDAVTGRGNALANNLLGNQADNTLTGLGGDDWLNGMAGADVLNGGNGNDVLDGGLGTDRMLGGRGDDRYIIDDAGDVVVEKATGGYDTIESSVSITMANNVERLLLTGTAAIDATGNASDNQLIGNAASNAISGMAGNDVIEAGGGGTDRLTGGAGADVFHFVALDASGASYANADKITDFSQAEGDKIDLSAMDADVGTAGDQAFVFIGKSAFSGLAGELQFVITSGHTYIQADINGDKLIDFVIDITGRFTPQASDFVL